MPPDTDRVAAALDGAAATIRAMWLLLSLLMTGDIQQFPGGKTLPHDKYIHVVSEADSPVEKVYIKSKDGVYVAAAMRKPKGNGPFPVLVHFHGAPGGRGMEQLVGWARGDHGGPVFERFLQEGYVDRDRRLSRGQLRDARRSAASECRHLRGRCRGRHRARAQAAVRRREPHPRLRRQPGRRRHHAPAGADAGAGGDPRRRRADPLPRRQGEPERATRGSVPRHDRRRGPRDGEHREGHHADPDPRRDRRLAAAHQPAAARSAGEGRQEGADGRSTRTGTTTSSWARRGRTGRICRAGNA